ncbi:MAG: family containing protein [Glaciihabitans sp.]|nr:family containing protein [Glaciihabitans sp.]
MTFELRTYVAAPGKMDDLLARFRDHTDGLFTRHGMRSVGYWVDVTAPNTLIYVLEHTGDPLTSWQAFAGDPEWVAAKAASEADGEIVLSIVSVMMEATDFSPVGAK